MAFAYANINSKNNFCQTDAQCPVRAGQLNPVLSKQCHCVELMRQSNRIHEIISKHPLNSYKLLGPIKMLLKNG